jgi:alpha-1,6-mannosyltransferase
MNVHRKPDDPQQTFRPVNTRYVTTGTLLSFAFILFCLVSIRVQWLRPGANYGSGLYQQLLAGIPIIIWTIFLLYNRIPALNRKQHWLLLILAVALRFVLIDVPPAQSDDIYRYIWEGRLHWEGFNPYQHAPDDPVLFHLRDTLHARINHGYLPAIYPPLTQWWNALAVYPGYYLADHPIAWMKLAYIFWDLMILLLLPCWLKKNKLNPAWTLVWAFHPLVIIEFSGNGHLDSMMIFLMLAATHLASDRKETADPAVYNRWIAPTTAGLLAAAVSTKIVPILVVPFFMWQMKRRAGWLLLVPILFVLAYLPYNNAGMSGIMHSIREYMTVWASSAPAFSFLKICSGGNDLVARYAYRIMISALVVILFLMKWKPDRAVWTVFMAYVVMAPVIHPWYALLVLPFALDHPGRMIPWIWLTCMIPLTYLNYLENPPTWAPWLVWLPFWLILFGVYIFRFWKTQGRAHALRGQIR